MTGVYDGRTAVVTGAASGIGWALCHELHRRGALVHAADRDGEGLAALAAALPGGRLVTHLLDVTDAGAVTAVLDDVVATHGRLDYLFNNAGIVVGGRFEDMDDATWRRIVDVNLWGVVHGTQHGYALMLAQGSGHIVNTASTAGVLPVARSTAYAATKHAIVGLSTSLREEGRRHGVRVSVVVPGLVDTPIFDSAVNLNGYDYRRSMDRVPIGKISPEQAARAILDGAARNRARIVFPAVNRLMVALYRLAPGPMGRVINARA